ncbi:MAG: histidine kinase [Lachnospiraceae bacterium]
MNKNKQKTDSRFFLIASCLALSVCIIYFILSHSKVCSNTSGSIQPLSNTWNISVNQTPTASVSLPANIRVASTDYVTMQAMLPNPLCDTAALCFRSTLQSVWVSVAGTVIYHYQAEDDNLFGKASPSRWNFVLLDPQYEGKTIQITTHSPYKNYSGHLSQVRYGAYEDLLHSVIVAYMPSYLICFSVFFLGIALIITSHLTINLSPDTFAFRYLGWFAILASLWLHGESKMPSFIILNPSFDLFVSNLSLMLCIIPYLLFIKCFYDKKYHRYIHAFLIADVLNIFICLFLQITKLADFVETAVFTHILIFLLICLVCVHFVESLKSPIYRLIPYVLGFSSFILSVLIELVLYYTRNYQYAGNILHIGVFLYIFCLIFMVIKRMIKRKTTDSYLAKIVLQQQIAMMKSHIQPHFLFNALGAIQSLIKKNPDTAYEMVFDFSTYLRSSIIAWENPGLIPFSTELDYIHAFTNIQSLRFRDSFQITYDIQTHDFTVPILSIRALVMNAVNHGVRKVADGGTVIIRSYEATDAYMIEVIDNGAGFLVREAMQRSSSTSGLHRTQDVLTRYLGASLHINSIPNEGTTVVVRIPKEANIEKQGERSNENDISR